MGAKRPFPSLQSGSGMRAGGKREPDGLIERLVETDAVAPKSKEQRTALRRWNKYQCLLRSILVKTAETSFFRVS